jgi:hypothetical protein
VFIFQILEGKIMDLLESIRKLPNIEKTKVMEFHWEELSTEQDNYCSPHWHKDALEETEQRMAQGKEQVIDWQEAKQMLRNESN